MAAVVVCLLLVGAAFCAGYAFGYDRGYRAAQGE